MVSDKLFHRPGLIYFWAINDDCGPVATKAMLDGFEKANVAAVVLHPRAGLELPYAGDDWFAYIKHIVDECKKRNLQVWLYDEDPYPSGNVGGRLILDHPEYTGHHIVMHEAPADLKTGENFTFPFERVIWAGLVSDTSADHVDLTSKVGVIRREWSVYRHLAPGKTEFGPVDVNTSVDKTMDPAEVWDSRFYYPDTPLYKCPRAKSHSPINAVRIPVIPKGMKLVAFTARHLPKDTWQGLVDSLNPKATEVFINLTHERYKKDLAADLGKTIEAIFTDEPKFYSQRPWTPGLLELFKARWGYDLGPCLHRLFSKDESALTRKTWLHYRQWCGDRFVEAWLKPVFKWCNDNNIAFTGHISPEDDPIQQANVLGNLMPMFKQFTIPGIDVIIPAVGDDRHSILNIGVMCATGVAQQTLRPGVMSETLGANGVDMPYETCLRILNWQAIMGVTSTVIHAAYTSDEGYRKIDAPPDLGPRGPFWDMMQQVNAKVTVTQSIVRDSRQEAPVGILWTIRSFQAVDLNWLDDKSLMRKSLCDASIEVLAQHAGAHFVDEEPLSQMKIENGALVLGDARYTHFIIPKSTIVSEATIAKLKAALAAGVKVVTIDQAPHEAQAANGDIKPTDFSWCPRADLKTFAQSLPKIASVTATPDDARHIRVTGWHKDGKYTRLAMNLKETPISATIDGKPMKLQVGEVYPL